MLGTIITFIICFSFIGIAFYIVIAALVQRKRKVEELIKSFREKELKHIEVKIVNDVYAINYETKEIYFYDDYTKTIKKLGKIIRE